MNRARSRCLVLVATLFAAVAAAQPAPPPPPLPPESASAAAQPFAGDPALEPQVTIIRRDTETLEEVRIGGELRFVRVTPTHGRPYYLVPDGLGGQFIRRNTLDTTAVKAPMWVLLSW